ncbi:hypothetical protein [Rhizobium sp. BK251]|uniref:hypothetical protein n=1 Tax=Rhizobium sp. BK251 TaxID=2512125 RepID=UPI001043EB49|nr:hypothetical protein [Rhizobium sp. BK251]TCL76227.1 hypothetical protein EV286_101775 [Rhizobium sp. BK251]
MSIFEIAVASRLWASRWEKGLVEDETMSIGWLAVRTAATLLIAAAMVAALQVVSQDTTTEAAGAAPPIVRGDY